MHDAPHGGPATRYSTTQTSALYIQLIPVPSTRRNPQSATVCSATFQWIHLRPIINHLPGMAFHMAAIHPSCTCNGRIPRGAQAAPSETLLGCWANARYTQAAPSETLLGCWANAESWLYDLWCCTTLPRPRHCSDVGPVQNSGYTTYSAVQLTLGNIPQ